jgi:hypothetical protein
MTMIGSQVMIVDGAGGAPDGEFARPACDPCHVLAEGGAKLAPPSATYINYL